MNKCRVAKAKVGGNLVYARSIVNRKELKKSQELRDTVMLLTDFNYTCMIYVREASNKGTF